jgi:hypothetical protein
MSEQILVEKVSKKQSASMKLLNSKISLLLQFVGPIESINSKIMFELNLY